MPEPAIAPSPSARPERILFIDDEANVLSAIQRQLRGEFNVTTANGGSDAVALLGQEAPFAAVVCDMRMPGMDGVATLAAFKDRSPDTTRVMLTGNADQATAVSAINNGSIFRFLSKPCGITTLRSTLVDALRQHELVTAEKALLQQTLTGSVRLLLDVLSLTLPDAFGRASRARHWVKPLADALGLTTRWDIEMAVMLAPIGYVAVPPQVAEKSLRGAPLSGEEKAILERMPETAHKLIAHIPRLKTISDWIYLQNRGYDGTGYPKEGPKGADIPQGARIAKFLTDLAAVASGDTPDAAALGRLSLHKQLYDPTVMDAAMRLWAQSGATDGTANPDDKKLDVSLAALLPGDVVLEPIMLKSGKLLLSPGLALSAIQIERLKNLKSIEPIVEPLSVLRRTQSRHH